MLSARAAIVCLLPGAAWAATAVCEAGAVPEELPAALRRVIDDEAAIGTPKPSAARPSGLILPAAVSFVGVKAPSHPALAILFDNGPLKAATSRVASTRRTAEEAAHRIAQHVDEWEQESGPLAATARRWRKVDPDRKVERIAVDLPRMVPKLGWWSASNLWTNVSARVEISPLRLEPFVHILIWTDSQNIARAVAIREKSSGDVTTWFGVRTSQSEVTLLKRLAFEEHTRFELYAICRPSR